MNSGAYILIVKLEKEVKLLVGRLGEFKFQPGFYVYVGSGMANLRQRIARHFSANKKLHWHIDYLLASENSTVTQAYFVESASDLECEFASELSKLCDRAMERFGCSDCGCNSHLFYFKPKNLNKVSNLTLKYNMQRFIK